MAGDTAERPCAPTKRCSDTSDFGHFGRVITNDYNSAVRSPPAPGLVCITTRTIGFSPTHRDFYLRLAGHCKQPPKHIARMARYGPWQTLWKTLTNGHHVTPPATCAYLKVPGLAGTPLRPGYSAREQWVLSKACRWLALVSASPPYRRAVGGPARRHLRALSHT